MRIVHTADWHIGKSLNDYSLLEDQRDWFSRFTDRLAELRPDALIVAGDIYDRSIPPAEAVSLLGDILRRIVLELHIETFLIAGNHDSGERLSFGSELMEACGLHIAGRVGRDVKKVTLSSDAGPVNFYLLPYLEPHDVKTLFPEETVRTQEEAVRLASADMLAGLNRDERNILVAHGLFSCLRDAPDAALSPDAEVGGSELVDASPFREFDYVALGHLHSPRPAGSERMRYAGSPLKYSVDEAAQQKSFYVVELSGKKELSVRAEALPPLRDVRVLEGPFEWLAERENHSDTGDYVFVNLTDSTVVLNAISRLKAVFPNILGLRYKNIVSVSADRLSSDKSALRRLTYPELFAGFYESVTGGALTHEERLLAERAFDAVAASKAEGGTELRHTP